MYIYPTIYYTLFNARSKGCAQQQLCATKAVRNKRQFPNRWPLHWGAFRDQGCAQQQLCAEVRKQGYAQPSLCATQVFELAK